MTKSSPPPPTSSPLLFSLSVATIIAAATSGSGGLFASAFIPPRPAVLSVRRPSTPDVVPLTPSAPIVSSSSSPAAIPSATARASSTALRSFFGLGPAELVLIAIAGLVVIGPSKLLEFSKEAGKVAGGTSLDMGDDLKKIPQEFKKGLEEGEIEARSRRAKSMKEVGKEADRDEERSR